MPPINVTPNPTDRSGTAQLHAGLEKLRLTVDPTERDSGEIGTSTRAALRQFQREAGISRHGPPHGGHRDPTQRGARSPVLHRQQGADRQDPGAARPGRPRRRPGRGQEPPVRRQHPGRVHRVPPRAPDWTRAPCSLPMSSIGSSATPSRRGWRAKTQVGHVQRTMLPGPARRQARRPGRRRRAQGEAAR